MFSIIIIKYEYAENLFQKDFQDWAKNNCGGIDESCDGKILDEKCFKNPFDSIDIPKFGLEDYEEWVKDFVKDGAPSDISKLEGFTFSF